MQSSTAQQHAHPHFDLCRSPIGCAAIGGIHAASLLPIWVAGVDPWIAVAISAMIVLHGVYAVRRYGTLSASASVTSIAFGDADVIELELRDGRTERGTIDAATVVTGRLTVIVVRVRRRRLLRRRTIVVAPDMLAADDFRRLRVLLMWRATGVPGDRGIVERLIAGQVVDQPSVSRPSSHARASTTGASGPSPVSSATYSGTSASIGIRLPGASPG